MLVTIQKSFRVFFVLLILWLTFGVFFIYFSHKNTFTINANFFIPILKKFVLNKVSNSKNIEIENFVITWNKSYNKIGLILSGVNLSFDNNISIQSNKIEFSTQGLGYFFGQIEPISIYSNKLILKNNTNYSFVGAPNLEFLSNFVSIISSSNIKRVVFDNILYNNSKKSKLKSLGSLILSTTYKFDMNIINIHNKYNDSLIKLQFIESYKQTLSTNITLKNVNFDFLNDIHPLLKVDHNSNISGNVSLKTKSKKDLLYLNSNIRLQNIGLKCNESKLCIVRDGYLNFTYKDNHILNNNSYLDLNNLVLKLDIGLKKSSLDFVLNVPRVNQSTVCKLWLPSSYARDWFCNSVKQSTFINLKLTFSVKKNAKSHSKIDVYFSGQSNFEQANIIINDRFKDLKNGSGFITFTSNNANLKIENAIIRNMNVNNAFLKINSHNDSLVMEASGKANGDLYDAYLVSNLDPKYIGFSNKSKISGVSNLDFQFITEFINQESFLRDLHLNAKIQKANLTGLFINGLTIKNASIDLNLENEKFSLSIIRSNTNNPLSINLNGVYGDSPKINGKLNATILKDEILSVGFLSYSNIKEGFINITGDFHLIKNSFTSNIRADISALDFYFPVVGWKNNFKDNNIINANIRSEDFSTFIVDSVELNGNQHNITGKGFFSSDNYTLFFPTIKAFNSDISALIKKDKNNLFCDIEGHFLDLSNSELFSELGGNLNSKKIRMKINNVLMSNSIIIKDVDLLLNCNKSTCVNSYVKSKFDRDHLLKVDISKVGVEVYSNDAGKVLSALGILEDIESGELHFFIKNISNNRSDGILSLTKFKVINAPILGAVLATSSLQSIVNTLSGSGIDFSNFTMSFTYNKPIIQISESWVEGKEIGVSVSGSIDMDTKNYIINGQVIPAYAFNKMIWSIPIIGKLLTGGKSRGIISINYGLKGHGEKYNFAVNVMSILTPTLLKEFLSVLNKVFTAD